MNKVVRVLPLAAIMLAGFASTSHAAMGVGGAPAPAPPGTPR